MSSKFDGLLKDDEIYILKKSGLSYEEISEYYFDKGIVVSSMTIGRRCRKIFAERGEVVPDLRSIGKTEITKNEIFDLREQGLSYRQISEHFKIQGINISISTVRNMCKEAYASMNEIDSLAQESRIGEIPEQRIFELREQGLAIEKMCLELQKEGYNISKGTLRNICIEIYARKGIKQPEVRRGRKPSKAARETLEDLDKKTQDLLIKKEKSKEIVKGFENIELVLKRDENLLAL